MLCRECRCQLPRRGEACLHCGAPRRGARARHALVLADGTRMPVSGELTIGRGHGNRLRVDDPAVSRHHARVVEGPAFVTVHDLGSAFGTYVDGHRVDGRAASAREGQQVRVGDTYLTVERERSADEPGKTVLVPVAGTVQVTTTPPVRRPRLRSGWALKRLSATEGPLRYVLANLREHRYLRFSAAEAQMLRRLDGRHTVAELLADAERRDGIEGIRVVVSLLADLSANGLLADAAGDEEPAPRSRLGRALQPRERDFARLPGVVDRLYRQAGYLLFTRPALALGVTVLVAGPAAFTAVAGSGVRPLHVTGGGFGAGAAAFLGGRLAVVALHELGHALTLASFGRRARRIGLKVVLVFPYAFVDTSGAWFESRSRRLAISAAGPVTDGLAAAVFSLAALATGGVARDIAFQLALGAYLGALLNLNPLLERDGYHVLVDLLRQPDLRRRAREHVTRRLAGRAGGPAEPRAIGIYGVAALAWSLMTAAFVAAVAARSVDRLAGAGAAYGAAGAALAVAGAPVALLVSRALRERSAR